MSIILLLSNERFQHLTEFEDLVESVIGGNIIEVVSKE